MAFSYVVVSKLTAKQISNVSANVFRFVLSKALALGGKRKLVFWIASKPYYGNMGWIIREWLIPKTVWDRQVIERIFFETPRYRPVDAVGRRSRPPGQLHPAFLPISQTTVSWIRPNSNVWRRLTFKHVSPYSEAQRVLILRRSRPLILVYLHDFVDK